MVLLALAVAFAAWVDRERVDAEQGAGTTVLHSSHLLAAVVEANIASVDKVLAGVEIAYGLLGDRNPEMLTVLQRQVPHAPLARGLLVIGPDGLTRYATSLRDPYTVVDVSDRDYFRVHGGGTDRTFVSPPLNSRNDDSMIVVVSRAMRGNDGRLLGVAAAILPVGALAGLTLDARPAVEATALIVDRNGIVLARSPDNLAHVGRSIRDLPGFEITQVERSGLGLGQSPLDQRHRLFAFVRLDDYPLVAVVSMEQSQIAAGWRGRMVLPALLLLAAGLVVVGLVVAQLRQLRRLDLAHDQLAVARIAADDANQAKSGFLAATSHELRTPLNAILGFTDALLNGIPGHVCQPRCREYLGYVLSSGQHLLSIINDLLDLAKVEAGHMDLARERTDLIAVVRETVAILGEHAERKAVALTGPAGDAPVVVHGDPLRLRQVFLNLLSNAIKFTPAGGRIEVAVVVDHGEARASIVDTGIGMTEEELAVARTMFGQVSSDVSRDEPGTGLGLPLADQLVRLHGGRLDIFSRKGEGSTVTVVLPLA